jgi:hypothetical protein
MTHALSCWATGAQRARSWGLTGLSLPLDGSDGTTLQGPNMRQGIDLSGLGATGVPAKTPRYFEDRPSDISPTNESLSCGQRRAAPG